MKKLYYVPIIHTEPDLGSVATGINRISSVICGEERWNRHKQTVSDFWNSIANYIDSLGDINLKIYQDGLMADGELGLKIIEEGARRGSKNHEIVLKLIKKGGEIRKTEDPSLLKEEYGHILKLSQSKSFLERGLAYLQYKMRKARLMEERDKFIARTINETLQDGETAILFIGAYHNVFPRLSKDILVKEVKEQEKVKAYFDELIRGKDKNKFEKLAQYLVSPESPNESWVTNNKPG